MNNARITPLPKDIDSLLGDDVTTSNINDAEFESKIKLRLAQNANRGRPKADAVKVKLKQLNVSCAINYCQNFEKISLKIGKTKRTLMEEALLLLFDKYTVSP